MTNEEEIKSYRNALFAIMLELEDLDQHPNIRALISKVLDN